MSKAHVCARFMAQLLPRSKACPGQYPSLGGRRPSDWPSQCLDTSGPVSLVSRPGLRPRLGHILSFRPSRTLREGTGRVVRHDCCPRLVWVLHGLVVRILRQVVL